MELSNLCRSYFSAFKDVSHYKENDSTTTCLAVLSIMSYFTVVIPLGFAAAYLLSSERVSPKANFSKTDAQVSDKAQKLLSITATAKVDAAASPTVGLSQVLETYDPHFSPRANLSNLQAYSQSSDYQRHAKTAHIYYNASQLAEEDALKIIFQREPTNIAMGPDQYNEEKLQTLFNYRVGIYKDADAKTMDGLAFKTRPNTAAVYSETYMWDPPGGKNKKEIACLSLPAPALDSKHQPHYAYYMGKGTLDAARYEQEIEFLFKVIEKAVRDHKDTAFEHKGIKRLILSRFGQGAFLGALLPHDRMTAQQAYKKQLKIFLDRMKELKIEIAMSEYSNPGPDKWLDQVVIGDIIKTAREGDLIVNAWDPHSAPGNGNDADASFDGAMGKGSGILLTQTSWLNETLRSKDALVAVK